MFAYFYSLILVYSFILYAYILYACAFSLLFYTLIGSLSDDSEFARSDVECFYFMDQVFDETVDVARSWSFPPPILVFLSFFYSCCSCCFLDCISLPVVYFIPYSYVILCGYLYMCIVVILIHYSFSYSLFRLL